MAGEQIPFPLNKDELERKREKSDVQRILNIDELTFNDVKDAVLENTHTFSKDVQDVIIECLAKGVSVSTASLFGGVTPATVYKWLKAGKDELASITEEQIEAGLNLEDTLSDKGKFFLAVHKAKAKGIVDMHSSLYERAFEAGKEYVAMYLLERADPDTYNLKRKIENESKNESEERTAVTFTFINGRSQRSPEDMIVIDKNLEDLKNMWGEGVEVQAKNVPKEDFGEFETLNKADGDDED